MTTPIVDGSNIKALVEDKQAFAKYVDEKFKALDQSRNGKLSPEDLQPVVLAIGSALGLPPKGTSRESDHIYGEVLGEFVKGKDGSITKEDFAPILKDMLLGVADGLERDPVTIITLNGEQLESYVESASFEVDALGVFSQLDKSRRGKLKGSEIKEALTKISVEQGMPPASDPKFMKAAVQPALETAGVDLKKDVNQDEFLDSFRNSVKAIASQLRHQPVTVAHTENCFDGKSISAFLQNKTALQQTLDTTWASVPKDADETFQKRNLGLGLDLIAPFAGLPPLGAVEEMDHVVNESLKLVDANNGGVVNKEEFCKCMLEILGGIMLQLQGKPISISSSVLAADSNSANCPPLQDLLFESNPRKSSQ